MSDDEGYCPRCNTREGPLPAHGLLYFYCLKHCVHWTRPARERADSAEAVAAAREICRRTVLIPYARTWRPAAGPGRG